jgi:hypothetical protein
MTSRKNPWSSHEYEERVCEYCGELFYAHHGLQRYCPYKYNRKNYCKNQQKQMVSESKLVERIRDYANLSIYLNAESPIEKNKQHLKALMGNRSIMYVTDVEFEQIGYNIDLFESKISIDGTNRHKIKIGNYLIEWMSEENNLQTFKIIKI